VAGQTAIRFFYFQNITGNGRPIASPAIALRKQVMIYVQGVAMRTLTTLALISVVCGAVLGATSIFIFHLPWFMGVIIGVVAIIGLFLIGLVLSTMA